MPRKLIGAAVLVALSTGVAGAQSNEEMWLMVPRNERVRENPGREREAERQYQNTLKNTTTGRKASNDPWRSIRPAATPVSDRHRPQ